MSSQTLAAARSTATALTERARGAVAPRLTGITTATRPLVERVRPVLAVVQPAGWVVLAAGVIAWWAGRRFGWFELIVVAVACLVALAIAVVFVVGRSEYRIHLELTRHRVVVGT